MIRWLVGVVVFGAGLAIFGSWYLARTAPLLGRWQQTVLTGGGQIILRDMETPARILEVTRRGLSIEIEPTEQRDVDVRVVTARCMHDSFDGHEWKFRCDFADGAKGYFTYEKVSSDVYDGKLKIINDMKRVPESDVVQRLSHVS